MQHSLLVLDNKLATTLNISDSRILWWCSIQIYVVKKNIHVHTHNYMYTHVTLCVEYTPVSIPAACEVISRTSSFFSKVKSGIRQTLENFRIRFSMVAAEDFKVFTSSSVKPINSANFSHCLPNFLRNLNISRGYDWSVMKITS